MSFILDALKKSDMQARQGELPSIHSSHAGDSFQVGRPRWQYALFGSAAAILVLGSAYVLLPAGSDSQPPASAPVNTPSVSATMPGMQAANQAAISEAVVNQATPPLERAAEKTPVAGATPPAVSVSTSAASMPPIEQVSARPALAPEIPPTAINLPEPNMGTNNVEPNSPPPLRNRLPVSVQQSLPPIEVSGHIYDEQARVRMVFINGHIQREGDTISPGLRLVAITPSGVEMSFRDTSFRINLFANRVRSKN